MLLVAMIANFFLQSSALMITLSVLAIGIFSLFILHDLKRVQDGVETNYISATLGVYLSLYNVFSNLLALAGHRRQQRLTRSPQPARKGPAGPFFHAGAASKTATLWLRLTSLRDMNLRRRLAVEDRNAFDMRGGAGTC